MCSTAGRGIRISMAAGLCAAMLISSGVARAMPVAGGGGGGGAGSDGPDTLVGGPSDDRIDAGGGNDRVYSRRGADTVLAGDGADRVYAGRGSDRIFGGPGPDRLFGEKGADRIHGNEGADVIFVGAGRDWAHGGKGDDVIFAKSRHDVDGRRDREGDRIFGGRGDDRINTRDGERDIITCGPGNDVAILDFKDRIADASPGSPRGSCEQMQRDRAKPAPSAPRGVRLQAVRWALGQLGVHEQPEGSNRGPHIDAWSQRIGLLGVAWCGIFVHESFFQAGRDLHNAVASTDFIRGSAEAEENGLRAIPLRQARRGDLVLLDFPGGDADDHVAIVTRGLKADRVTTVDGNSSNRVKRNSYATSSVAIAVRVTA